MADVKNFGLIGLGTNVQYGKAGSRIINNAGTFNFKNAAGSGDVAITTAGITSSAGNVTLTTGNVVMSAAAGTLSIGGDTTLSRHAAGIFQMDGTAAFVLPSGTTGQQPTASATTGGVRYNSTTSGMEYSDGTQWVQLATGGVAVTAVSVATANGLAGTSSGGTTPQLTLSTTVTGVLKGNGTAISAAVSGTDLKTVGGNSIIGAGDVGTIGPTYGGTGLATFAAGTVLYASATDTWAAAVPGATSGVQPYDTDLTALANTSTTGVYVVTGSGTSATRTLVAPAAGITISNADGVSGNPTFALANDLAALEALSTRGYAVRTSNGQIMTLSGLSGGSGYSTPGTYTGVALTGGSGTGATADITVAGGAVTSVVLVNAGSGYLATDTGLSAADGDIGGRSGGSAFTINVASVDNETWTTRTINGTSGRVVVSNGNGVASNTDIDLATVTDSGTGTFLKFTRDSYGRVTGTTSVVANDIETLVNGTYVNVTGDTMSGNLVMSSAEVTGLPSTPSGPTAAASKAYVDALVASGATWLNPVTDIDLVDIVATEPGSPTTSTTYIAYGASPGYPQTWTGSFTVNQNDVVAWNGTAWVFVDTLTAGDRFVIAGEHGTIGAGLSGITISGHTLINSDLIQYVSGDPTLPAAWTLPNGTAGSGGTLPNGATVLVSDPNALDYGHTYLYNATTYLWVEIAGPGAVSAGIGLYYSGNVLNVGLGAGIQQLPSDEIGLDIVSGKAVQLTSSLTGGQLDFVLDGAGITSGLTQSASGLKIAATGVTNAMLTNSSITVNGDTGSFSQALGGTLIISGDATQGVSSTATAGTVDFTVQDASYTGTKGVAAFTATEFVVTGGVVAIGVIGNSNLANSSITFTGDSGSSGAIALGGTLSITGDSTLITTTGSAGNIDITLGTVNVAHGGTGLTTVNQYELLFGGPTNTVTQDVDLQFNPGSNTLTVGSATLAGAAGGDVTLTATATNGDINLVPNGTGAVIIGPAGAGLIQSDPSQPLTVRGNTFLSLESVTGDTTMILPASTTYKVTVSGPTATQYATGLANEDLVNKYYVDTVAGSATGDVKAVSATVTLTNASTNIGAALPAGATILSVKVNVTAVDTGTGTLEIGKSGNTSAYMTAVENDTQIAGLYLAETDVTEAASEQVIATCSGATSGTAKVIVTYQIA
jgi:hypothetical protein